MKAKRSGETGEGDRVSRIERLLNLLSFLLLEQRLVLASEIQNQVDGYRSQGETSAHAFSKLLQRDVAELREAGVPVAYMRGRRQEDSGYLLRRDSYYLPQLDLDPVESVLLDQLAALAAQDEPGRTNNLILSGVRKLSFDRPGAEQEPLSGLGAAVMPALTLSRGERDLALELAAAVGARQAVRFDYYSIERDVRATREIEPFGLRFVGGHWSLVGRDQKADALRTFRVSRIEGGIRKLGAPGAFDVPADFALEQHVPRGPWGFGDPSGAAPVRVLVEPGTSWLLAREVSGERGVALVEQREDGSFVYEFAAGSRRALVRRLARWLEHVEVLSPPGAREDLAALGRAARERHLDVPAGGGKA